MVPFPFARLAGSLALAAVLALALSLLGGLSLAQDPPDLPGDLALDVNLFNESDNVVEPNHKTIAFAQITYTGDFKRLTVAASGTNALRIRENNARDAEAEFSTNNRQILTIPEQVLTAPETLLAAPGGLSAGGQFGRAVASDGVWVAVGGGGKVALYNAVTGERGQVFETPAADRVADDDNLFGASVAIAGDYVAIGAPGADVTYPAAASDDTGTTHDDESAERIVEDVGRVYIFSTSGGGPHATYTPVRAVAYPPDTSADPATTGLDVALQFGASVSLDNAGRILVVGAPLGTPAPTHTKTGAAYVFTREADTPDDPMTTETDESAIGKWAPAGGTMVTAEGFVSVNNSDAVLLYWTGASTNGPSSGIDEAGFGAAVAISGDGKVIAVGAPKADQDVAAPTATDPNAMTHTPDIGAVLVFLRPADTPGAMQGDPATPGVWVADSMPDARLDIDPNTDSDDTAVDAHDLREVGRALSISENGQVIAAEGAGILPVDPDGNGPMNAPAAVWKGAAFIWEGPAPADALNAPAWSNASYATARLTGSDSAAGDRFGSAVALKSDGSQIVVADAEAAVNQQRGGVWLFDRPANGWDRRDESATPTPPAQTAAVEFPTDGVAAVPATSTVGALDALAAAKRLPRQHSSGVNAFFGAALAWVEIEAVEAVANDPNTQEDETVTGRDAMTKVVVGQPENSDLRTVASPEQGDAWLVSNFEGGDVGCRSTTDDPPKHFCPLELGNAEIDLVGLQADDNFVLSGSVIVTGRDAALTDSYDVLVGVIREVNSVTVSFADNNQPTSVLGGETVNFKLEIKNEKNAAADPEHISTVQIVATGGSLSSTLGSCSSTICTIQGSQLSRTGANATNNIRFSWRTPRSTGSKRVTATVITNNNEPGGGGSKSHSKSITTTGSPASLSIAQHTTSLYYRPTSNDNRDVAKLEVTARDDENKLVAVPDAIRSWDVRFGQTGGGGSFKSQFSLERVPPQRRDPSGKVFLELKVEGRDLDPGIYQLEVQMARATGVRAITVAGPPVHLNLEVEGQRTFGGELTYTARVRDTRRAAVANGTRVTFELTISGTTVLAPTDNVTRRTTRGRAETTYTVIGTGRAIVKACAGNACDVSLISVGGFLPGGGGGPSSGSSGGGPVITTPQTGGTTTTTTTTPPPPPPVEEQLSERALDKIVTWQGAGAVRGKELLDAVTEAVVVMLWNGKEWLPYGRIGLMEIPGSINFVATRGDQLWFSGPQQDPPAAESEAPAEEGESEPPAEGESGESGASGGDDS